MELFKTIGKGISLRSLRLAGYAWLFNILFSFIIYFGFYMVFTISAGRSMIEDHVEMYGLFTVLMDIFNNFPGSFSLLLSICFYFVLLYAVSSVFISAGIFSVMMEEEKAEFFTLLSASIENFFKFLKVFLVNLINFGIALLPMAFLVFVFWKTLERSFNETMFGVFLVVSVILAVIIMILSVAIYDYSRIIRLRDGRNFFFSFRGGIRFVFSHKKQIVGIFLFYMFSSAILYMVFKLLMSVLEGFLGFIGVFLLYQIFLLIRYLLKVVVIHGEFEFIRVPYSETE